VRDYYTEGSGAVLAAIEFGGEIRDPFRLG
jgi:hypothetical protein